MRRSDRDVEGAKLEDVPLAPADADVLSAEEARRFLRLGPRKFEEIRPRLPSTRLGRRSEIYSRRLLLEWVEANAEIVDPRQLAPRRLPS